MERCNIATQKKSSLVFEFTNHLLALLNLLTLKLKTLQARVAELVDAADSKSAVRKDVLVRFQSRALLKEAVLKGRPFFIFRKGVGFIQARIWVQSARTAVCVCVMRM